MAIKIKFDTQNVPESPTMVLMKRSGEKLGTLPAKTIHLTENMNSAQEIQFVVHKEEDGKKCRLWNELRNFRLLWCKEWNVIFELYVEIDESDDTRKNVTATSLGEVELGNTILFGIEVNTEDDILTDDYIPTVLFRAESDQKRGSLLDRLLYKMPNYEIAHVDASIANIQRTFSFDNTSIYDAFNSISEEIDCLFQISVRLNENGEIVRSISVYDLESYCNSCGHRGDFIDCCPECQNTDIKLGYGEDTTIFITTENLADSITFTTDTDSVKNCFRLEAGDDLMTETIANINPNGSRYLWYISDETKEDMSDGLVSMLDSYDIDYAYYNNERIANILQSIVEEYNTLITKYQTYKDDLESLPQQLVGYPSLMEAYYNAIDFKLYLESGLMPSVEMEETTAQGESEKLTAENLSPIAVTNIDTISSTTASSAILAVAKTFVAPNYQVKINSGTLSDTTWTGNFVVTNYSNDEDTATSETISIQLTDDKETYLKQMIEKKLNESVEESGDIATLFEMEQTDFVAEIKKYCLVRLNSFHDACQACLDIMLKQGIADSDKWSDAINGGLYDTMYSPYYDKLLALELEIQIRTDEINIISGNYDNKGALIQLGIMPELENEILTIQKNLNFENYLGEYWSEFTSFRREDVFQNSNYISDGLSNSELIDRAQEFIKTAKNEIKKSATLQHSISASLKNLLVMKEFHILVDYFKVGNWLRLKIDDKVYRLRLINYDIDFDNLDGLSVEFSDVKETANGLSDAESILNQAKSIASSYSFVARQASQGAKVNSVVDGWTKDGLNMTKLKIVDQADNQEVTWDNHGLLCREFYPITDTYSQKQLRLINTGIYLTDDNWRTSKAAIGNFYYKDPETGNLVEAYGVNGETIVGTILLGEQLGIYNSGATLKFDQDGLLITNGVNIFTVDPGNSSKLFALSNTTQDLLWVDSTGTLHIRGDGSALDISSNSKFSDYSTTTQMNSAIDAKADAITLSVSQTLTSYSTTEQMNSAITASASSITSTVSQTYETKTDANSKKSALEQSISTVDQKADSISSTVSSHTTSIGSLGTRMSSAESSITQNASNIALKVSESDYTGATIASKINQSASTVTIAASHIDITGNNIADKLNESTTTVTISASKINLNGAVTANSYFKINSDGSVETISGKIGGFAIDSTSIHTNGVAVTSNADNSVSLSSSTFTRTIGSTSRSNLKFAIGANFAVSDTGILYASNGIFDGGTIQIGAYSQTTNSYPFQVSSAGVATATGIIMKSGYIGNNWVFDADGIFHVASGTCARLVPTCCIVSSGTYRTFSDGYGLPSRAEAASLKKSVICAGKSSESFVFVNGSSNTLELYSGSDVSIASSTRLYIESEASSICLGNTSDCLRPTNSSGTNLGHSSYKWDKIYCSNATIDTSDLKEKDVIGEIDYATDLIMSLSPIKYMWKNGDHRRTRMGFIAQEVAQTCKNLNQNLAMVTASYKVDPLLGEDDPNYNKDYFGEEVDDNRLTWGLAYSELIAPIVAVIQNQQNEIEILKRKLNQLEKGDI